MDKWMPASQGVTSRDEEEVAGYAAVMETIFASWKDIPLEQSKDAYSLALRGTQGTIRTETPD
jgi:hypothetical protein